MSDQATENTDIRLFTDSAGNEVFTTRGHEGLGINVGGLVIVKPVAAWHALANLAAVIQNTAVDERMAAQNSESVDGYVQPAAGVEGMQK